MYFNQTFDRSWLALANNFARTWPWWGNV